MPAPLTPQLLFQHFESLADTPDAIDKLRDLVLEVAIQGKLSTQNPKDEPVSQLIGRIKARLAATDNARAKKTRDALDEEEPQEFSYPLPEGWVALPLGKVTNIVRGITFPSSAKGRVREPNTVACLRTTNVQAEIEWDDILFIPEKFVTRDDQWLKSDDLVISMANSAALVGKIAQARTIPEKATFGGFLAVIRPIELDPSYLLYFLRSPSMQAAFRATSSQTTNIANISLGGMRPLPVAIPPLAEQRRIVAKVEELLALCDELETRQVAARKHCTRLVHSALDHLAGAKEEQDFREQCSFILHNSSLIFDSVPALRQAILSLAVQGRLVPQDAEKDGTAEQALGNRCGRLKSNGASRKPARNEFPPTDESDVPMLVPGNWKWIRFGEVADRLEYGTSEKAFANAKGVPTLRMGNIQDGKLDFGNLKYVPYECPDLPKLFLEDGDIIFNRTNSAELVGKAAVFRGKPKSFTLASYLIRVSLDKAVASPDFFNLAINSGYYRRTQIEPELTQQCGQANFSGSKLANSVVPLPPIAEQQRIVAKVDELMRWCGALEARLTAAQTTATHLLDATLHQLLQNHGHE